MRSLTAPRLFWAAFTFVRVVSALQMPLADDDDDDDTPLPLLIWHGLGDSFANDGIREVGALAETIHPGTFVYTIHLGDANEDRTATFYGNITTQLEQVCADVAAHPILSTAPAVDALGFSQGGVFLRAYIERCNFPPVRSLVTFGSPHNGISTFRECPTTDLLCKGAMALLRFNTWSNFVQSRLVPAQYFRDPADYDRYLEHSNFLADINNERAAQNKTYALNLASLERFVMYMFGEDTTMIPKESAWFENVNGTVNTPLRGGKLYHEDWLGLKELDRKGGLKFIQIPGDHMQIGVETLNKSMTENFGPMNKKFSAAEPHSLEL